MTVGIAAAVAAAAAVILEKGRVKILVATGMLVVVVVAVVEVADRGLGAIRGALSEAAAAAAAAAETRRGTGLGRWTRIGTRNERGGEREADIVIVQEKVETGGGGWG